LKELPPSSYEYDNDYPAVAKDFKKSITSSDAILFVTTAYIRSIPGALKNAIDLASRPHGTNAFARKPQPAGNRRDQIERYTHWL